MQTANFGSAIWNFTVSFSGAPILFLCTLLPGLRMQECRADDFEEVITHDIVNLGRHPDLPVHAPSLIHTGTSLLAVHGFSKVGGTTGYGDIYRSADKGVTWEHRCNLPTYNCGSFFKIGKVVYLLYGDSKHDDKTRLRQSENDGLDWSAPVVIYDKALWDGNGAYAVRDGYLYKALDERQQKGPSLPRVLKLKLTDDPMKRDNWVFSSLPAFSFPPPVAVRDPNGKDLRNNNEGNCVVGPDGKLWVIYRHYERTRGIFNATVFFDDGDNTQLFRNVYEPNPVPGQENCYSDFPGGCSGFHIAYDKVSGKYIGLSNPVTGETLYPNRKPLGIYRCMRNVLVMMESDDLKHWRIAKHLLKDGLEPTWEKSVKQTGFQQINFQFDGDDLIWISRTAYDGAGNLHDANRITFHRLPEFRQYLNSDDEVAYYSFDDPAHLGKDQCKQAGPGFLSGNRAVPVNVTGAAGRIGGAAAFNGKNAHLDVNYRISTEFHRADAVTIACWLNVDALPTPEETAFVFKSSIHQEYAGVCLGISNGNIAVGSRSCRQDAYSTILHPLPGTKQWVHLVAIYDFAGKKQGLYLDGKQAAQGAAAYQSNLFMRGIPSGKDAIGEGFAGRIDELHLYKKRLTSAEIHALYTKTP